MLKKIALSLILSIMLGSLVACGGSTTETQAPALSPALPSSAVNEIYAISQDETVGRYIEVRQVEDKGEYLYVGINIKYDPEIIAKLEDAFIQAEVYTDAVAQDTVKIINKHGIDKDVSVWAQLPLGNNEVALLGNTWYDAKLKSYNFKRYKP